MIFKKPKRTKNTMKVYEKVEKYGYTYTQAFKGRSIEDNNKLKEKLCKKNK